MLAHPVCVGSSAPQRAFALLPYCDSFWADRSAGCQEGVYASMGLKWCLSAWPAWVTLGGLYAFINTVTITNKLNIKRCLLIASGAFLQEVNPFSCYLSMQLNISESLAPQLLQLRGKKLIQHIFQGRNYVWCGYLVLPTHRSKITHTGQVTHQLLHEGNFLRSIESEWIFTRALFLHWGIFTTWPHPHHVHTWIWIIIGIFIRFKFEWFQGN